MTEQTDLEKLSNKEIRELWKQTTDRARRVQAEQRQNAIHEPTQDEGYHKDGWGNLIEGPAPKLKENRYYIDSSGWLSWPKAKRLRTRRGILSSIGSIPLM
jgi:hypothetical protein